MLIVVRNVPLKWCLGMMLQPLQMHSVSKMDTICAIPVVKAALIGLVQPVVALMFAKVIVSTEASEYAARAGSEAAYWTPSGGAEHPEIVPETYFLVYEPIDLSDNTSLSNLGKYCYNTYDQSDPINDLLPNSWGLFDMYGNISEWTMIHMLNIQNSS